MRIAVAGGGIAGLTAAIALAQRGFQVDVFERAAENGEVGAGIQLSPNAMAVLDRLGLSASLQGRLFLPEAIQIGLARTGAVLARIPLGETARNRYGSSYGVIHRADLHAALLRAARAEPGIGLHFHAEVHGLRATEAGVAFTAGGQLRVTDLLVGADGVHSRIRAAMFGDPGPCDMGRVAWRATVPGADVPASVDQTVVGLWFGADAHLVHYPLEGGTSLNVVLISAGHLTGPEPPRTPFGRKLGNLLDAIPAWTRWPLFRVDPKRPWSKGRMVLVGDAAHAMAPSAAQGGAQAIEDAWVLARSLAAEPSQPAGAVAHYERIREPRVRRISREADRNLWVYNLGGPLQIARNLAVAALPPAWHLARMDWLFRPPAD